VEKVCGFTIVHTDEADKLLWYNSSLLKNKAVNSTALEMIDGSGNRKLPRRTGAV